MPMKVAQRIDVSKFMSYIKVRQLSHMKGNNNDLLLLSFGHRASLRRSHLDMHLLLQFSGCQLAGTNQVLSVRICSPCPHSFKLFLLLFLKCGMLNWKKREILYSVHVSSFILCLQSVHVSQCAQLMECALHCLTYRFCSFPQILFFFPTCHFLTQLLPFVIVL